MPKLSKDYQTKIIKVIKEALSDFNFRKTFKENPRAVFLEHGIDIPIEKKLVVLDEGEETPEEEEGQITIQLPPLNAKISDEQIQKIVDQID